MKRRGLTKTPAANAANVPIIESYETNDEVVLTL